EYPHSISLEPSLKRNCAQFYRNETRLVKYEYSRVLCETDILDLISKLPYSIPADSVDFYFLPHHAALKEERSRPTSRLSGGHSLDSTIRAREELSKVLTSSGFPLRKW
ncbi:unnamed protein product, partial [Ceratitis capitata]